MTLTPIINTDIKMPAKMLNALNLLETRCVVTGIKSVTEAEVKAFLAKRFGEELACKFDPKFLFSSPAV